MRDKTNPNPHLRNIQSCGTCVYADYNGRRSYITCGLSHEIRPTHKVCNAFEWSELFKNNEEDEEEEIDLTELGMQREMEEEGWRDR